MESSEQLARTTVDCPGECGQEQLVTREMVQDAGQLVEIKPQQGCQLSALEERWSQLLLETSVNARSKTRGRPMLEHQS